MTVVRFFIHSILIIGLKHCSIFKLVKHNPNYTLENYECEKQTSKYKNETIYFVTNLK